MPLSTDQQMLAKRAKLVKALRTFLDQRGLIEVQTPVITRSGITDLNIESVKLSADLGYLRTSPEYAHKQLLARGVGDIYEIGPVFRAEEAGHLHRTEFTLLEWYRLKTNWKALAQEALDLCQHALRALGHPAQTEHWRDWSSCFTRAKLPDPLAADDCEIIQATQDLPDDCDREMRLDWLFSSQIQRNLPEHGLTIVYGYPAAQAALAKLDPSDARKSLRFELFCGSLELANGYQELTDWREQLKRFENDNRRRQALGRHSMPIDQELVAALKRGLPECAGIALGVDRLAMKALEVTDIAEVRSF